MSQVLLFLFFSGSLSQVPTEEEEEAIPRGFSSRSVCRSEKKQERRRRKERERESIKAKGKMEIEERESAIAADGPDATNGRSRWAWLPCGYIQPARAHTSVNMCIYVKIHK